MAKRIKDDFRRNVGFQEVIADVLRSYHISEEENVICFWCYFFREAHQVVTNVISADVQSKKPEIQIRIDRLNELYSQIINIKDHLIKQ